MESPTGFVPINHQTLASESVCNSKTSRNQLKSAWRTLWTSNSNSPSFSTKNRRWRCRSSSACLQNPIAPNFSKNKSTKLRSTSTISSSESKNFKENTKSLNHTLIFILCVNVFSSIEAQELKAARSVSSAKETKMLLKWWNCWQKVTQL